MPPRKNPRGGSFLFVFTRLFRHAGVVGDGVLDVPLYSQSHSVSPNIRSTAVSTARAHFLPAFFIAQHASCRRQTSSVPAAPTPIARAIQKTTMGETHSRRFFFSLHSIIFDTPFLSYCARGAAFYTGNRERLKNRRVSCIMDLKDGPFQPFAVGTMRLRENKPMSKIHLFRGGVLDVRADAVVNAANESLLGGGGVDGAIHRAAGPKLLEECRTLNGCETGDCKITKAYNITWAKHIIHAVGPRVSDADVPGKLAGCYARALELAAANDCRSVAFPCISTGVYGVPIDLAAKVALRTVGRWLQDHPAPRSTSTSAVTGKKSIGCIVN